MTSTHLAGDVTADSHLVLVEASQRPALPGEPPIRTQISAEKTRHRNLVIAPCFHHGRFGGGFMLLHIPSGMAVRNGYDLDDMRNLARRLDHLDWAAADTNGALPDTIRAAALEIIRAWHDELDGLA